MSNNRESWWTLLAELQRRSALAESMGGAAKLSRHHSRGRLDARERIQQMCDAGAFNEYGQLAGGNHPGGETPLAGDGVVGGTGRINDRSAVLSGAITRDAAEKATHFMGVANAFGLPLKCMPNSPKYDFDPKSIQTSSVSLLLVSSEV